MKKHAAIVLCALCLSAGAALAAPMTGVGPPLLPSPVPSPTAMPQPGPTAPPPAPPQTLAVVSEALPATVSLRSDTTGSAQAADIRMPAQDGYAQVPGVLTFRGGPFRQNAAYGYAEAPQGRLEIVWQRSIGALDNWSGVGWNGQPALVQWHPSTRAAMQLHPDRQAKDGLIEVIYATLDGNIYFLDLDDGEATRDPIEVGFPLKGSVSVDPRGWPLLYSGQGISRLEGKSGRIGMRVFSLLDGSELLLINGRDEDAYRNHGAFDSVPLLDATSDTLIVPGENGLLHRVKLNTAWDAAAGTLTISPVRSALRYRNSRGVGIESSIAVYGHYGYFTDNGGLLMCVDLNTLAPVWAADVGDDSDSSPALDVRPDGRVLLFTGCEVDLQKRDGFAYLRCYDALTGALLWTHAEPCTYDPDLNGGLLASPLVGQGVLSDTVYFHVAKVREGGGSLLALDKDTGEVRWRQHLPRYGWSSPVAVYGADSDAAHILLGDSGGTLRLLDAHTGETRDTVSLQGNIEGSPAVYGDMLVIGTRGRVIYGIRIR